MGVKSRLCALVLSTSIVSCVDPAVDARAVWVDAEVDGEGVRTLHLYDQGELRTYEIGNVGPTTSGATATLILEQDPVARGVLVRAAGGQFGGRIATYVDVDGRRNLPILLEADGRTRFSAVSGGYIGLSARPDGERFAECGADLRVAGPQGGLAAQLGGGRSEG